MTERASCVFMAPDYTKLDFVNRALDAIRVDFGGLSTQTTRGDSSWLGGRDSNPDSQIQSLESYHWTTSQQRSRIYEPAPQLSISSSQ